MKLVITLDLDEMNGLDYQSITDTINDATREEVRREVTRLVRLEMTQRKAAIGDLVRAAFDNTEAQLKVKP